METTRRSLLLGLGSMFAAPAIVHAENLMKIPYKPKKVFVWNWETNSWWVRVNGIYRPMRTEEWPSAVWGYPAGEGWVTDIDWVHEYPSVRKTVNNIFLRKSWPGDLVTRPTVTMRKVRPDDPPYLRNPFLRPSHLSMSEKGNLIESTRIPGGEGTTLYLRET